MAENRAPDFRKNLNGEAWYNVIKLSNALY